MAKKWKAYPWPERPEPLEEEEEEIDVVGDSPGSTGCWGPSSPTAGATAPSPPPTSPHGTTLLYNGKNIFIYIENIFYIDFFLISLLVA